MLAAVALIALAGYGLYQGLERSAADADVTASTDGLLPTTNVVAARNASALVEPPPPILTEAQIRTIARQEVQAALTRPADTESSPRPASGSSPSPASPPVAPPATVPVAPPAAEPPPLY